MPAADEQNARALVLQPLSSFDAYAMHIMHDLLMASQLIRDR